MPFIGPGTNWGGRQLGEFVGAVNPLWIPAASDEYPSNIVPDPSGEPVINPGTGDPDIDPRDL